MVRSDKVQLVEQTAEKLKQSQGVVLTDFKGLTVAEISDLRTRLRNESVEMRVIKNRLLKRAISEAECDNLDEYLVGNTAVAFGIADPVTPAKILVKYAKDNEKLLIKGGLLDRQKLDPSQIQDLAKMPGREELLTIMARDLKQPATKLATVMQNGLLKVAHGMQALARKLEEAGEAAG